MQPTFRTWNGITWPLSPSRTYPGASRSDQREWIVVFRFHLLGRSFVSVAERFQVSVDPDAEETPFVYELNADTTEETFPEMPLTELRDGLKDSLTHYLESVDRGDLSEADLD